MRKLLLLTLTLLIAASLHAQDTSCTQNLNQAEDRYAAGLLQGIPGLLNSCLTAKSFSKEETIRAYKLLTLVYIFNDEEQLAEENMISLLKTDPEHAYDAILDPAEFIFLYNKFRTQPIFRIGVRFAGNLSEANVIDSYNSNTLGDFATKEYSQEFGIGGEVSIEREFYKYFEGVASIGFHQKAFSYEQSPFGYENLTVAPQDVADGPKEVLERQSVIDGTLMVRAFYRFGNFYPYLFGGIAANYLLSTSEGSTRGAVSTTGIDLVSTNNREQFLLSAVGGAGVKIRLGVDFINLEFRYINGLDNVVITDERYPVTPAYSDATNTAPENINRQDRLFATGLVDDNFGVNSLMFSIGFIKSFYNPQKIK